MAVFGIGGKDKDGGGEKPKLALDAAQAAKGLPALAALLAILGAWLLVTGGLRMRDDARTASLQGARDTAIVGTRANMLAARKKLEAKLATPALMAELQAGNRDLAARAIAAGWTEVKRSEIWSADLQASYAGLPKGGYGSLATAEAALATGKTAARVVKAGGEQRLALAAPVRDARGPAVAYVELSLGQLTRGIEVAELASGTYLALRQGDRNVLERGNAELAGSAESLAAAVPDSETQLPELE